MHSLTTLTVWVAQAYNADPYRPTWVYNRYIGLYALQQKVYTTAITSGARFTKHVSYHGNVLPTLLVAMEVTWT